MKKWIFILSILFAANSFASEEDTIYLDAYWKITKNRANAKYWREIISTGQDSLIVVHDYWLSTGNMQMVGTYVHEMKPANQHGRFQYYYSDGTLKAIYDYKLGIIHGELRRFYQNGNLKSIEQYDLGNKIDTSWMYYESGQLWKILVQNMEYSDQNPSDKYSKQRLVASYSELGEVEVEGGIGTYREYFLSGKVKTEVSYENGLPHGKWIKYSGHKKKVSCVMTFKEGRFIKGEIFDNGKKDIFSSLQRKTYFPTGIRGLEKFIDENTGDCEEGFNNEVIVLVDVSTEGRVRLDQIISGNTNACQYEEIQNLIHNMPLWVPAVNDGVYIEGSHSIKINFSN